MLLDIIDAKTLDNFLLLLKFENGEEKKFDCKPLFNKKIFKPLSEKHFFIKAKVSFGTVSWTNSIDISPETLYIDSKKAS